MPDDLEKMMAALQPVLDVLCDPPEELRDFIETDLERMEWKARAEAAEARAYHCLNSAEMLRQDLSAAEETIARLRAELARSEQDFRDQTDAAGKWIAKCKAGEADHAAAREALKAAEVEVGLLTTDYTDAMDKAKAQYARAQTAEAELTAARSRIARYQARLEIDHEFRFGRGEELVRVEVPPEDRDDQPDGIECRDATIELQDKAIARLKEKIELQEIALNDLCVSLNHERAPRERVPRVAQKVSWRCPECGKPEGQCDPEGLGHYRG